MYVKQNEQFFVSFFTVRLHARVLPLKACYFWQCQKIHKQQKERQTRNIPNKALLFPVCHFHISAIL